MTKGVLSGAPCTCPIPLEVKKYEKKIGTKFVRYILNTYENGNVKLKDVHRKKLYIFIHQKFNTTLKYTHKQQSKKNTEMKF